MNLVRILEESARKFSRRACIIWPSGNLSFSALNEKANQLVFSLEKDLKVNRGERVALLLSNCPEFIVALFAILKSGAVCAPLNVFLSPAELGAILKDCQAKILISSAEFIPILRGLLPEKSGGKAVLSLEQVILTDKQEPGFLYWPELFAHSQIKDRPLAINPQDLALLLYTSGTTGAPKGVMLSHHNLWSNALASVSALKFSPRDRFLLLLPMFHSFTLMVCILVPIKSGARIVIIRSLKPFQKVLRGILFQRVTVIVGIPQLYDILKDLALPYFLRLFLRVRVCISGAAALNPQTWQAFKDRFKEIALLEGYGLTETSPVVSLNPLEGIQKPGSVGLPLPGVEVKVVGDDESELACGEIGELIVKGPNVMLGYYQRPEETEKALKAGWLFTGDMAKIDHDGYIYIVGRKKEMLITHGMNVYPQEIENVLSAHPKIQEIAVIGKKDKFKGEVPVAFVVLKAGSQASARELIDYCKDKLANYKIPRLIEFRASLPKAPTGKILKRELV